MRRTDRAETIVNAEPTAVWAALTDPARVAAWLPPAGMTGSVDAWEPRPGGRLRIVLTYRDAAGAPGKSTADSDVATGRFTVAEPPVRLAWTTTFAGATDEHAGEMTMEWTLAAVDGGTRVVVQAHDVPPGISAEDHAAGMAASLRQLADHVAAAGLAASRSPDEIA
jgi:uncharacterized protein YndB with AHSA1/START domain